MLRFSDEMVGPMTSSPFNPTEQLNPRFVISCCYRKIISKYPKIINLTSYPHLNSLSADMRKRLVADDPIVAPFETRLSKPNPFWAEETAKPAKKTVAKRRPKMPTVIINDDGTMTAGN